jgi:hypothetical protein
MALVQKGTSVVVGFNGVTYTNFIMQDAGEKLSADKDEILDESGDTATYLFTDKIKMLTLTGVVKGTTLATVQGLIPGGTITVNTVAYIITDVDLKVSAKQVEATITCEKPDEFTYA